MLPKPLILLQLTLRIKLRIQQYPLSQLKHQFLKPLLLLLSQLEELQARQSINQELRLLVTSFTVRMLMAAGKRASFSLWDTVTSNSSQTVRLTQMSRLCLKTVC